jgi:hypothetical protein
MDYKKVQEIDPSLNMKSKITEAKAKERDSKKKDYYKTLEL